MRFGRPGGSSTEYCSADVAGGNKRVRAHVRMGESRVRSLTPAPPGHPSKSKGKFLLRLQRVARLRCTSMLHFLLMEAAVKNHDLFAMVLCRRRLFRRELLLHFDSCIRWQSWSACFFWFEDHEVRGNVSVHGRKRISGREQRGARSPNRGDIYFLQQNRDESLIEERTEASRTAVVKSM